MDIAFVDCLILYGGMSLLVLHVICAFISFVLYVKDPICGFILGLSFGLFGLGICFIFRVSDHLNDLEKHAKDMTVVVNGILSRMDEHEERYKKVEQYKCDRFADIVDGMKKII